MFYNFTCSNFCEKNMINSIQSVNIPKTQSVSFKRSTAVSFPQCNNFDTFECHTKSKKRTPKIYPFSCKQNMGLFSATPQICKKLKYDSIKNEDLKTMAVESIEMAKLLREFLSKKYAGQNNTYVCIGTSPAGVMKSMELMGDDVRYMPISGLRHLQNFKDSEYLDLIFEELDTDKYKNFINSIGLSADEINSSANKTIFYDYTLSGTSLDIIKHFVLRSGVDESKVEFRSLNKDLLEESKTYPDSRMKDYVNAYILTHLLNSEIGHYCGIPHVDYKNLNDIESKQKESLSKTAADFNFALLYNMEQKGLLNI